MDFFGEQDAARRNSRWLVVLFMLAVAAIVVALYLVLVGVLGYSESSRNAQQLVLWQPDLFLAVAVGVSTVILLSSLFKVVQLSSGGGAKVAESLDGRLVTRSTDDRLERRLLNVVDEMAIAAGIPVPKVYVLDNESGINAFAAGTSTSDAVVAVTRGTLEQLNRDELQGMRQKAELLSSELPEAVAYGEVPDLTIHEDEVELAFLREKQRRVPS